MSRIRSIHPGFFTDEEFVTVSAFARLLFLGLGVEADDKGVFEWKPARIKMRIFPADNVAVEDLLVELTNVDAIRQYEIGGRQYGAIRNFRRFQRPKSPNDIHPAPADIRNYVALEAGSSENSNLERPPFPPNGEKRGRKRPSVPKSLESKRDERPPFPPNGEMSPQMEDGGWRMEDGTLSYPEGGLTYQESTDTRGPFSVGAGR